MKFKILVSIALLSFSLSAQDVSRVALSANNHGAYETTTIQVPLHVYDPLFAPPAPQITTEPAKLEVCAGGNTTLTAVSEHEIHWFISPPPLGEPVARGTSFVTPPLSQGYYVYYAIAHNGRSYSNFTSIDIVMVYPLPVLNITASHELLCSGETATLSARGCSKLHWNSELPSSFITIAPTKNTTYTVTGMNTAGCTNTATFTQRVENCAGIGESGITHQEELSIYPNPNHGEFNIQVSSISGNSKGEIYNTLGELVYSCDLKDTLTSVNLIELPTGIYFVRIIENGKEVSQKRLVKE